ncbi:MAG: HEAT repeat domain-containing protein [Candidatus Binatia bacterium]
MELDDQQTAALIADLDHHDKPTLRAAVDKLIALASELPRVREILNHRLAEAGHGNYWPVAYILGHLAQPPAAAIERLLDALDHREPDIRWAIALLLVRVAKQDTNLVDSLIRLCASGTINQKRMALYSLRDLALSDAVSSAALLKALGDPDATVRVAATICLKLRADLNDAGRNILLQTYLKDSELKVRNAAAIALANLGAPDGEFLIALRKNRDSKDEQTRKAAIAALDLLEKRRSASSGSASDR